MIRDDIILIPLGKAYKIMTALLQVVSCESNDTVNLNLNERKLLQETCREFYDFMTAGFEAGIYQVGVDYNKKDMCQAFLEEYPEMAEEKRTTQRRFTQWMHKFAMYSELCGPIDQDMCERRIGDNRFIKCPPKDRGIPFFKKTTSSTSNRQKDLRIKETSMDVIAGVPELIADSASLRGEMVKINDICGTP